MGIVDCNGVSASHNNGFANIARCCLAWPCFMCTHSRQAVWKSSPAQVLLSASMLAVRLQTAERHCLSLVDFQEIHYRVCSQFVKAQT